MSVEFLIGADPELFVRDREGNLVSAYGMIEGTKAAPLKVEGGAVQVDGMALEFNIDPAKTFKEFDDNITNVLRQLKEMIPNGYSFDFSPVAQFGKEYIESQPEEARELGCDPDFDAHSGKPNPRPNADMGFRTASGHIHIGWTNDQDIEIPEHIEACQMAVKQLDVTLGLFCRRWDKDLVRSSMYGKLGAYRPKPYGVEYRTLSNVWVNDPRTRKFVFECAMDAMKMLVRGDRMYEKVSLHDINYYLGHAAWEDINYYSNSMFRYMDPGVRNIFNSIPEAGVKKEEPKPVKTTQSTDVWNFIEFMEAERARLARNQAAWVQAGPVVIDPVDEIPNEGFEEDDFEDFERFDDEDDDALEA